MKNKTMFVIITIVFAAIALALSPVIWPDAPGSVPMPTAGQLPFFIFLATLEAIAFGVGVAFLFLGWKYVKNLMPENRAGMMWSFIAITWLLVSWWPHDNMHRVNGMDLGGLLKIEYTFHFTLILASLILAWNFWKMVKPKMV